MFKNKFDEDASKKKKEQDTNSIFNYKNLKKNDPLRNLMKVKE